MASSVEKLAGIGAELNGKVPETPEEAQLMALFQTIGPVVAQFLPNDAEALDALLLAGAEWALSLRSDDAATQVSIEPPMELD